MDPNDRINAYHVGKAVVAYLFGSTYCPNICLEGRKKTTKTTLMIACLRPWSSGLLSLILAFSYLRANGKVIVN
jgi:hypothetical protein